MQRDDEVSRKHAVIRIKNGAELYFRIADLNSSNGTFLNGERIAGEVELLPEDIGRPAMVESPTADSVVVACPIAKPRSVSNGTRWATMPLIAVTTRKTGIARSQKLADWTDSPTDSPGRTRQEYPPGCFF